MERYAELEGGAAARRELAGWYGSDGRWPAQLAVWRRILSEATKVGDAAAEHEARTMVRALVIVVDGADPVASPADASAARRAMAALARRGG